jgi:hypothetical protein
MTRDPVVTYSRRPALPSRPTRTAVAVRAANPPFADPTVIRKATGDALRSGALTLAVVASVAAIAAGVGVVATSYNVRILQADRTAVTAEAPFLPASLPRAAVPIRSGIAIASFAPAPVFGIGGPYLSLPAAPAIDHGESLQAVAVAAVVPPLPAVKPVPPMMPPLPNLRPAVPEAFRVALTPRPPVRTGATSLSPATEPISNDLETASAPPPSRRTYVAPWWQADEPAPEEAEEESVIEAAALPVPSVVVKPPAYIDDDDDGDDGRRTRRRGDDDD